MEVFPETENAHVNLSLEYSGGEEQYRDFEKALHHGKIALSMRPGKDKYKLNLGVLYGKSGRADHCVDTVTNAMNEHPNSRHTPTMLTLLGQCLIDMGRFERANDALVQAVSRGHPSAPASLHKLKNLMKDPEREKENRRLWEEKRNSIGQEY